MRGPSFSIWKLAAQSRVLVNGGKGRTGHWGAFVALPDGMTMQEAERIVAERGKAIRDRRTGMMRIREAAQNAGTLRGLSGD